MGKETTLAPTGKTNVAAVITGAIVYGIAMFNPEMAESAYTYAAVSAIVAWVGVYLLGFKWT